MHATAKARASEREQVAWAKRIALYTCEKTVYGAAGIPHMSLHRDPRSGRILIGGNKSAKSTTGTVESYWWLTGQHPFRKTPPPPVYGRCICPELPQSEDDPHVQRQGIREWFPSFMLRGGSWGDAYSLSGHTLHLANGSYLEFLSSAQAPVAHSGAGLHFVWFDEEFPRSIFTEEIARLAMPGFAGEWWMTLTPILGLDWYWTELIEPGEAGTLPVGIHMADIEDNRHNLPEGFIERFEASLRPEEREARLHGKRGKRSGLVFDIFGDHHLDEYTVEQTPEQFPGL